MNYLDFLEFPYKTEIRYMHGNHGDNGVLRTQHTERSTTDSGNFCALYVLLPGVV